MQTEAKEAAQAYEEYYATFLEGGSATKPAFIKGSVINSESGMAILEIKLRPQSGCKLFDIIERSSTLCFASFPGNPVTSCLVLLCTAIF